MGDLPVWLDISAELSDLTKPGALDDGVQNLINSNNADFIDKKTLQTPLHVLAKLSAHGEGVYDVKRAQIRSLVAAGAKVDARDYVGRTPLMMASMSGSAVMVKELVAAGADVNALDQAGNSPMSFLAQSSRGRSSSHREMQGASAISKVLLEAGAEVRTADERWCLSLLDAKQEVARLQMTKDLNTPDSLARNYQDGLPKYNDSRALDVDAPPSLPPLVQPSAPRIINSRWKLQDGRYSVVAAPESGAFILNPWERTNLEKCLGTQPPMVTRYDPDLAPSHNASSRGASFLANPDSYL